MSELYTREQLIGICESSIVNEDVWSNRDSAMSQKGVGKCWALLKAGCNFKVLTEGGFVTDDRTIWVEIDFRGFSTFEGSGKETSTFYLPTPERLKKSNGSDWY